MAANVVAPARYGIPDGLPGKFGHIPADDRDVTFHDMRDAADPPSLQREGFGLFAHETRVEDFEDSERVAKVYLAEVRELIQSLTGTPDVFMQSNWVLRAESRPDHTVTEVSEGKHSRHAMKTGGFLHLDYDAQAAELFASKALANAGVTERPQGRLLALTAWRAISPPPHDRPLAVIDRRTVRQDDLIHAQIAAPNFSWHGYQVKHSPAHRFCWWSNMTRDEILLFTQYEDGVEPQSGAPHTAFLNPSCPPEAPTRHSIEVRAYCFLNAETNE